MCVKFVDPRCIGFWAIVRINRQPYKTSVRTLTARPPSSCVTICCCRHVGQHADRRYAGKPAGQISLRLIGTPLCLQYRCMHSCADQRRRVTFAICVRRRRRNTTRPRVTPRSNVDRCPAMPTRPAQPLNPALSGRTPARRLGRDRYVAVLSVRAGDQLLPLANGGGGGGHVLRVRVDNDDFRNTRGCGINAAA